MEYDNRGLMAVDKTEGSPLLDQLRAILSPAAGPPRTLEQRLASLNEIEQKLILQTARFVHLAMQMRQATNDKTMGYADLVQSMYRGMSVDKRQLIAEFLDETAPLDFEPTPNHTVQIQLSHFMIALRCRCHQGQNHHRQTMKQPLHWKRCWQRYSQSHN